MSRDISPVRRETCVRDVLSQHTARSAAVRPLAPSVRSTRYLLRVTEFQVTYWRDLPSMVVARDGDNVTKSPLASRFQEAIDEAAMRLGETSSDDYLAGWTRGEWIPTEGDGVAVCDRVVAELEEQWPAERVTEYLGDLGP